MGVDRVLVGGRWQARRQMSVLNKYAEAPSAKDYWLTGPTRGPAAGPSTNFTLDVRGYLPQPVVFRCFDGWNATAFITLTTTTRFTALMNFTYTSQQARPYQIYCQNDSGFNDAPALTYTTVEEDDDTHSRSVYDVTE